VVVLPFILDGMRSREIEMPADPGDGKSHNPPYVSYQAFDALIAELSVQGIPDPLDRSCFQKFSDPVRAQLVTALRFLRLIDATARPTATLHTLTQNYGQDQYRVELERLLISRYGVVADLDLATCTPSQLSAGFDGIGCSKGVVRKAELFYLKAANAAGRRIGPRLEFGRRTARLSVRRRDHRRGRATAALRQDAAETLLLRRELIRKFPDFDERWPPDVKLAWITGFQKLVPPLA
jgi:hypothetical protein